MCKDAKDLTQVDQFEYQNDPSLPWSFEKVISYRSTQKVLDRRPSLFYSDILLREVPSSVLKIDEIKERVHV